MLIRVISALFLFICIIIYLFNSSDGLIYKCKKESQSHLPEGNKKCPEEETEHLHIAALILARGGSKGIKLKNLAKVGGVPLLRRSLNAIVKANVFDSVWVSTDHELIAAEAVNGGALVHHRSEESATDTATSIFAVQEFLKTHREINILALVQCTSPFLKPEFIQHAFDIIRKNKRCVFSVKRSFKLRWKESGSNVVPVNFDPFNRPRRQDWVGELIENGMFYFTAVDLLVKGYFQDNK